MDQKKLGKRIRMVRKERGYTTKQLSELCCIDGTYLRQIESGVKTPSISVFIILCNALRISPDYLLRDFLAPNEISNIRELERLWETASLSQQEAAVIMIQALLKHIEKQ